MLRGMFLLAMFGWAALGVANEADTTNSSTAMKTPAGSDVCVPPPTRAMYASCSSEV